MPVLLIALLVLALAAGILWARNRRLQRDAFIRNAPFPTGLMERLAKRRPELSPKDRALVARALRQFFLAYLHSGFRFVSMPSQVVDDLWHEMILYTRLYDNFCQQAFGRFMHHTPAVVLSPDKRGNEGLRRAWWFACKEENINPRQPNRLPLLFAIDAKLTIADGFVYSLDCKALRDRGIDTVHCAGDFGDSSIDGGTDGFGDSSDGGSGSDGGDGGSGCGGGCGGGD